MWAVRYIWIKFGTELKRQNNTMLERRTFPNSLIMKIQDGGGRHIEFRKMWISPDWMKMFPPNLMDRCITAMWWWWEVFKNNSNPVIQRSDASIMYAFNPLMGILKPQSNGPLYSYTVIGTLAVDGYSCTFGTAAAPLSPLLAVPDVTAHPSSAIVPA